MTVKELIGARTGKSATFDQCDASTHFAFADSGETGHTFIQHLSNIVQGGRVKVLLWVSGSLLCLNNQLTPLQGGDADMKSVAHFRSVV